MSEDLENDNGTVNETKAPVHPIVDPVTVTDEKITVDTHESEFLSLLNVDIDELDKLSESYAKVDQSNSESTRLWTASYLAGLSHLLKGGSLTASVERASSEWVQKIDNEGDAIGPSLPNFGTSSSGKITGDKALLKVAAASSTGTTTHIPLWHTGIWVTLKPPTEGALLELDKRITSEKILLGRYTSGLIFSNTSVYTASHVINFVLNHLHDSSVKDISHDALKKIIKVTDIPTLLWGMACSINPDKYKYSRACTTNPANCQHVVTGEISLGKLFWMDDKLISIKQRRHMSKRLEKFTLEDLKAYEEEHIAGSPRIVTLNDRFKAKLTVPNITQYETAGFSWVDGLVKMAEGSLGVSLNDKQREEYILDQAKLTTIRQYGHWVSELHVDGDIIDDFETLEGALGQISGNSDVVNSLFEHIGKFIDDSTLAVVAIPKYDCPACGTRQEDGEGHSFHEHLLPIDVLRTFFTLLDQHMYKALLNKTL